MRPILKQSDKRAAFSPLERKPYPLVVVEKRGSRLRSHSSFLTGFTIVELMTVMSVIIILISLLVPGLNALRRYARNVTQRNQFYAIDVALETFHSEWGRYPHSSPLDALGQPYCGAMKFAEAMVGKDFLGYSPSGVYPADPCDLSGRRLYLPIEKADVHRLKHVYQSYLPFVDDDSDNNRRCVVLCGAYPNVDYLGPGGGKLLGMPILYYRANTANMRQFPVDNPANMYNLWDNNQLVALGPPSEPGTKHPLDISQGGFGLFYQKILNQNITTMDRPHRADSYILLSAGHDGLYGTDDDIFNFRK